MEEIGSIFLCTVLLYREYIQQMATSPSCPHLQGLSQLPKCPQERHILPKVAHSQWMITGGIIAAHHGTTLMGYTYPKSTCRLGQGFMGVLWFKPSLCPILLPSRPFHRCFLISIPRAKLSHHLPLENLIQDVQKGEGVFICPLSVLLWPHKMDQ